MKPPRFVHSLDYAGPERRGQITRFKLWLVTGLCTILFGAAIYLEAEWRKGVNEAIVKVPVIEQQAMTAVNELREIRKEQLGFYAVFYERIGAMKEAEDALSLLRRLERAPTTLPPTPAPR